jgi:hypothetical protein
MLAADAVGLHNAEAYRDGSQAYKPPTRTAGAQVDVRGLEQARQENIWHKMRRNNKYPEAVLRLHEV